MPKRFRLNANDYTTGWKRFFITLPVDEIEKLIALSDFQEPTKMATVYVRERIRKEYEQRFKSELPGQQHLFGSQKKRKKEKKQVVGNG